MVDLEADVKAKKINLVITKDLSRLGRNYLEVGNLIEKFFPRNRTRYIAFNDGIDTASDGNDIMPFKTVLNEMYSKDISKKVHSSYVVAAQKGLFTGVVPPIGYLKDPNEKGHLIIDPETAPFMREIFHLALLGRGPGYIRRWLEKQKIPCPSWWHRQRGFRNMVTKWEKKDPENGKYVWDESIIKTILTNPIYRGAIASQKRYHLFKVGDIADKLPDEWIVVENRHEPLVSSEDFAIIQEKIQSRTHPRNNGKFSLFAGLIKCGECGKSLIYHSEHAVTKIPYYTCKTFQRFGKHHCSNHRVDEVDLRRWILEKVHEAAALETITPDEVTQKINEARRSQFDSQQESLCTMIARDEDRLQVLSRMLAKIYEDRMMDLISDENFEQLRQKTQAEQKELETRIRVTRSQLNSNTEKENENQQWTDLIGQYTNLKVLDSETLNRLVRRIVVHENYDQDGLRHLRIEVYFNFQPVPFVKESIPANVPSHVMQRRVKRIMNVETGQVFDTLAAACASVNRKSRNCHIRECCENKAKTARGYHWVYVN